MTDKKRIELMARCVQLVRARIDANGGYYNGGVFVPNLQSVIDLGTVDEKHLVRVEEQLAALSASCSRARAAAWSSNL